MVTKIKIQASEFVEETIDTCPVIEPVNNLIKNGKLDTDLIAAKILEQPQVTISTHHYFGPGVYIREVKMLKNSVIIGHHHIHTHLNNILSGSCLVLNDDGSSTKLTAPMTFIAPPGQKVLFILEDCVFQNVYSNSDDEQDINKLEDKYCIKTEEFKKYENDKFPDQLLLPKEVDKKWAKQPYGGYKYNIFRNEVYADGDLLQGELIGYASIGSEMTALGAHIGYSDEPNATIIPTELGDAVYAISNIAGKCGGLVKNKITIGIKE